MPVKPLPSNPNLDHLKYQARDLLNALTQGNAEALARTREFHPNCARLSDDEIRNSELSLADAQLVVAREYGFPSWPKLKHHVEALVKTVTATPMPSSGFQAPAGPVELRPKWPLGTRIIRETNLKQDMEIYYRVEAHPVKQQLSLVSQYAYTVVKELPGGGCEVELQHLGFRFEFDSRGRLWRYDSARNSEEDQSEIAKLFNIMLRAKVRYFLDANNKVERMEGVDELVNRLNVYEGAKLKPDMTWDNQELDKMLSNMGQRPSEAIAWGVRKMFDENYFRYRMDPFLLPDKAVQPRDMWTTSHELRRAKRGFFDVGVRQEATVAFRSWEMRADRLCARLDFNGTWKTSPQVQPETATRFTPIIEGTVSGAMWFDPESGRAIESNMERDFNVTSNKLAISVPYTKTPTEAVTDHHHQVVTEKLISVNEPGASS